MSGFADQVNGEREARVLLSLLAQPDDRFTGGMLARLGGYKRSPCWTQTPRAMRSIRLGWVCGGPVCVAPPSTWMCHARSVPVWMGSTRP